MSHDHKLATELAILVQKCALLSPEDRMSVMAYAGNFRVQVPPPPGPRKAVPKGENIVLFPGGAA